MADNVKPVIYVTQPILPEGRAVLDTIAEVHENALGRPHTEGEMIEIAKRLNPAAFLGTFAEPNRVFSRRVIEAAPNLKVIAWNGLSHEHIDLAAASEHGIYVTYVDIHCPAVSDHAFALLTAAARRIVPAVEAVRAGRWEREGIFFNIEFTGTNIHGRTIGIVGLGRIGAGVAKRATGFDMNILYCDPVRRPEIEKQTGAHYVPFETLLAESDFVCCCVPLNPATRHMFGRRAFGLMKKTAMFINVSRGGAVDTEALHEALAGGLIEMAALDVIEPEPFPSSHPLLKLTNIILVPHMAGLSRETRRESHIVVAKDAVSVLQGYRPALLLNPDVVDVRPLPENA